MYFSLLSIVAYSGVLCVNPYEGVVTMETITARNQSRPPYHQNQFENLSEITLCHFFFPLLDSLISIVWSHLLHINPLCCCFLLVCLFFQRYGNHESKKNETKGFNLKTRKKSSKHNAMGFCRGGQLQSVLIKLCRRQLFSRVSLSKRNNKTKGRNHTAIC